MLTGSPLTRNASSCYLKKRGLIIIFLILFSTTASQAYSLLTHEAMIDVSWKKSIEPLLLKKFPQSSPEQLLEAHSYAYGGAIMPDIGYSPFGSMIYTDFVHNVRSGDYVEALLEEAEDLNEYAFALGALAHYMADTYGHMIGTNAAVPLVYPKLKAKFGSPINYAQHHKSHSRMELSFDVLQTARGNYASKAYHDFIGFNVSRKLVEKAFKRTYGLNVNDVFKSMSVAISTFRWTIKSLLPNIVRTAWAKKRDEMRKESPDAAARRFSFRMKNRTYYHQFGKDHQKAGLFQTVFAVMVVPILPKVGPLAKLRFKTPSPEVEKLFIRSFDSTLVNYEQAMAKLHHHKLQLPNRTLDTGFETVYGEYPIADSKHAEFLLLLNKNKFENLNADIRNNLISFFATAKPPANRKEEHKWDEISVALKSLQAVVIAEQGIGSK